MSNFLNVVRSMGFTSDNYTSIDKRVTNPIKRDIDGIVITPKDAYDELDRELTNKIQEMFGLFDEINSKSKPSEPVATKPIASTPSAQSNPLANDDLIFDEPVKPSSQKKSSFDINKKIEASFQGDIEDCWLLSGLNSMSYSSKGAEIIKNAITVNNDNSYTVTFSGINEKVNITEDEMTNARSEKTYSFGDDDVLLVELAVEKILNKMVKGEVATPDKLYSSLNDGGETTLAYGRSKDLYYLLTGNEGKTKYNEQYAYYDKNYDYNTTLNDIYDLLENNSDNAFATISFYNPNATPYTSTAVWDVEGNKVVLVNGTDNHSWSIKSVQKDTVTITNPFDSSISYTVYKSEIDEYAKRIDYCKL